MVTDVLFLKHSIPIPNTKVYITLIMYTSMSCPKQMYIQ